jgi:hypothetical protein
MVARALPTVVPAPRREFHVVVGHRSRRRPVGHWVLLAVSGSALFLLLVLSRIALDGSAFDLQELESAISGEETRYWELRMQVSELRDPARIAGIAAEMGMVYPEQVRAVSVPGLGTEDSGVEERWATLKTLLSAQP